jgi:hypothetical protein
MRVPREDVLVMIDTAPSARSGQKSFMASTAICTLL